MRSQVIAGLRNRFNLELRLNWPHYDTWIDPEVIKIIEEQPLW